MTDPATNPAISLSTRLSDAVRAAGFCESVTKPVEGGRMRVHFRATQDGLASLTAISHALGAAGFDVVFVDVKTGSWSYVDVTDTRP